MIVNIHLAPNAKKNEITGFDSQGILKVKVTARPVEGKANEALIELLSKKLRLPKSAINIKQGLTSKNKLVEIKGLLKLPEEYYGKTA